MAIAAGALLPWLRGGGRSANALEVPIGFLFGDETSGEAGVLNVGLVLLGLAVAGGVLAGLPGRALHVRACGAGAAVVATVFLAQVQSLASKTPGTKLTSTVGLGVLITTAGGVLLAVRAGKGGR
jgi:hypothetical protein